MLRRFLPLLVALSSLALNSCGSSVVSPVHAQYSGTPGTLTVSWDAVTKNTDGSLITGLVRYTVYEMQPCSGTSCAVDSTIVGTVATGVTGTSAQITNVPDGNHCYAAQTVETLPNGAVTSSDLSAITSNACVNVTGSSAPQPTPNSPTNVKATT